VEGRVMGLVVGAARIGRVVDRYRPLGFWAWSDLARRSDWTSLDMLLMLIR
jgi:hypothetical protein